jgi:predicted O-methyltransferase YrrM
LIIGGLILILPQQGTIGMHELKKLFDKYQCDKGTEKHHYYKEYETYFENKRNEPLNILEIGTFKGASTAAFSDYFPNGTIYTIDIFERKTAEDIPYLKRENVKWLKGNSMDAGLGMRMKKEWGDVKFDYIIDDGAHYPEANRLTFQNCYPFLKKGGVYFVEDFIPLHLMSLEELKHDWILRHAKRYTMLEHNKFMTELDQHNYKFYDRRKEIRTIDTFIVAITK